MPERFDIVTLTVGYAVILTLLGSAPALVLARGFGSRLVLAPALGFALAASLLSTANAFLTLRQATWWILAPACVASTVLAVVAIRRERPSIAWRNLALPLVLAATAVACAVTPFIARDTEGPVALKVYDAWVYIESDVWLDHHRLGDPQPVDTLADLFDTAGYAYTHAEKVGLSRVGLAAVNAPVAHLLGSAPDRTHVPMMALLFALIGLGVWASARAFGAGRWAAAFGSVFGLSAVSLVLLSDSALGNLVALAIAPIALALLARGLLDGQVRMVLAAAILTAGLICCYPEFVVPLMLVIGFECAVALVWLARGTRPHLRLAAGRILRAAGVFAAVAVVLAPVGLSRAYTVLSQQVGNSDSGNLPPRAITWQDGPAWAFGLLHLYQLPRFDILSTPKTIVAMVVPVLLVLIIVLGVPRLGAAVSLVALGPIVVGLAVAAISYRQRADCSYCLWKALTFVGPFLGIAVALGIAGLVGRRRVSRGVQLAGTGFALAVTAIVLFANSQVGMALYHSEAVYRHDLRAITSSLRSQPADSVVLLEGMDATAAPTFTLPSAYHAASVVPGVGISVAPTGGSGAYLMSGGTPDVHYRPAYTLVATAFAGLESGRERIGGDGPFALDRRAPIDVSPQDLGWTFDASDGDRAIPWVGKPFDLRVSGTESGTFSVTLGLRPSRRNGAADVALALNGAPLADRSPDPRVVCVEIPGVAGALTLKATPTIPRPTRRPLQATESDPIPPVAHNLGLSMARAQPGGCPAA